MFVADNVFLIRNFDVQDGVIVQDDGLATEAAFDAGVDGPVDEIFFLITDFFQRAFAVVHVDVAGAASADFPRSCG